MIRCDDSVSYGAGRITFFGYPELVGLWAFLPKYACFLVFSLFLFAFPSAKAGEWAHYENHRFGTSVDVPATGFDASPPPTNGDGQEWLSVDGQAQILVYGSFVVTAETFAQYREELLSLVLDDGVDVTYSVSKDNWFVYSGYLGADIVYGRVTQTPRCSSLIANHLYLRYPIYQKTKYDRIVKRMSESLSGNSTNEYCD